MSQKKKRKARRSAQQNTPQSEPVQAQVASSESGASRVADGLSAAESPAPEPSAEASAAPGQRQPEVEIKALRSVESGADSKDEVYDGPRVLWSPPGRLVLGFAVAMSVVWWGQETFLVEQAQATEEVVVGDVPEGIGAILSEAGMEDGGGAATVGGPAANTGQKRGLVNLFKTLTGGHEDNDAPRASKASEPGEAVAAAGGDASKAPTAASGDLKAAPATVAGAEPTGQGDAPGQGAPVADGQEVAEKGAEPAEAQAQPKQADKAPAASETQESGEGVAIEDPNGAMKAFYDALRRTERKEAGAVTRVVHWGDSVIVADMMTGTARRKLQERFGDSGHGFMLVSQPWEYYVHQNVKHKTSGVWRDTLITKGTLKDRQYGMGGVMTSGRNKVAWSEWSPPAKGKTGRKLSRFQVFYAEQPEGGDFLVQVDGKDMGVVSTKGGALTDKVHTVEFPDGEHTIRLQANGGGEARFYGVVLERDTPGVVYDCLGVTGSRASTFIRFDTAHFKRQLAQRSPNLMVIMTGANQSKFKGMDMAQYEKDYLQMVQQLRSARPEASCLVAGSTDRADKTSGQLATSPLIPKIIEVQRRVALANGCAFWNTAEAMGGQNAIIAWHRHKPRLASGDYTHLTMAGGEVLGTLFYKALMAGYKP